MMIGGCVDGRERAADDDGGVDVCVCGGGGSNKLSIMYINVHQIYYSLS